MDVETFLRTVITTDSGWFCLSVRTETAFVELWYSWPNELPAILEAIEQYKGSADLYFSAHLFKAQRSTKENVLPTKTIQCDLDNAEVDIISITPSILVQTSEGRHQAYWLLSNDIDNETVERLSRKMTYSIHMADTSGWSLGHKYRLPETFNYKYKSGPQPVAILDAPMHKYISYDIDLLEEPAGKASVGYSEWIDAPRIEPDVGPNEYLARFKSRLPAKVILQYNMKAKDRSEALWYLELSAFRSGLTRDEVFWLARRCANNKFTDLRYNGDRELAKDILRAEASVNIATREDVRASVLEIRKMKLIPAEKHALILEMVRTHLLAQGRLHRGFDDSIWYVRSDTGRPIHIARYSEFLDMMLDIQFGLNPTEREASYTVLGLASYARNMPPSIAMGSLSYYSNQNNTLLIHTGRKDIYVITENSIERAVNGSYGVIFPWASNVDPFNPNYEPLDRPWTYYVFGDLSNAIGLTPEECHCILKNWFIFLLLRTSAISRPLLALFGQPGSGKSTIFRRIYALLYGPSKSITSLTNPEDFDHAVSSDPLVVLDNLDSWEKWLPDRLALSASDSDIVKRKLYTDKDTVTLRRQALIGITAHSPKFVRADVADRLLLINFERLGAFSPESAIIEEILKKRNTIWGHILQDLHAIIRTPKPSRDSVPQFRVEDFARLGVWASRASGEEALFKSTLSKLVIGQKSVSLEEEGLLVTGLQRLVEKRHTDNEWYTPAKLWTELETMSPDPLSFRRVYGNAIHLGRRMWILYDSLKEAFHIEWRYDPSQGTRTWNISANHKGDLNGRSS